jgi:hypothetical protein
MIQVCHDRRVVQSFPSSTIETRKLSWTIQAPSEIY